MSEEIEQDVRKAMERSNLVYRCVVGELTETQLNWWLNKLDLNRDEILAEVERTKNSLRTARFVIRLIAAGVIVLLLNWLW